MSFEKVDDNLITFGEWLVLWYDTYKVPNLKPYSLRNIEQVIRLHTPEWLKSIPIKKITLFDFDKALSQIPNGRTKVYVRQVWREAFARAEKYGFVARNVVELTDNVRYKKKGSKALTASERKEFIKALEGRRFKWVMLFYLHTGVRRAEALTLLWSDIDTESNLILIRGTKTEDSQRYIILTEEVKTILEEQRKQIQKEKIKDERVFPYSNQQASKNFKLVCPNHHLHDLRHTFVTLCCESGVNVAVCQQLVGHSTADMTMNVYTHVMDEYKRKEALKFSLFPKL
ncbi:MAG: site-specific integrase [Clostridia bacterium]|nr:site-specific integrase [Clostridia bacterium]